MQLDWIMVICRVWSGNWSNSITLTLLTVSNELTKNNTLAYLDSEVCVCALDLTQHLNSTLGSNKELSI